MGAALKKQLQDALENPKDDDLLEKLVKGFDKDKSGEIDEAEFKVFVSAMSEIFQKKGGPVGEYAWKWAEAHPHRWFVLFTQWGDGNVSTFQNFFREYFSSLDAQMEFLAKLGYFRHAHSTPALGGVGIDEEYMSRVNLSKRHLKAVPARDELWNNEDERALLKACKEGDAATVKKLLARGVDPNVRDVIDPKVETAKAGKYSGASPVYYAALGGHADILEMLHLGYAVLGEESYDGRTALHAAAIGWSDQLPQEKRKDFAQTIVFLAGKNTFSKIDPEAYDDDYKRAEEYAKGLLRKYWSQIASWYKVEQAKALYEN